MRKKGGSARGLPPTHMETQQVTAAGRILKRDAGGSQRPAGCDDQEIRAEARRRKVDVLGRVRKGTHSPSCGLEPEGEAPEPRDGSGTPCIMTPRPVAAQGAKPTPQGREVKRGVERDTPRPGAG